MNELIVRGIDAHDGVILYLESAGLVTTVRQSKYKLHYIHTAPLKTIVERWLKPGKKGARE